MPDSEPVERHLNRQLYIAVPVSVLAGCMLALAFFSAWGEQMVPIRHAVILVDYNKHKCYAMKIEGEQLIGKVIDCPKGAGNGNPHPTP